MIEKCRRPRKLLFETELYESLFDTELYESFWPGDVFIIPPSSGALALHVLIIIVKYEWKIVKSQNEYTKL